MLILNRQELDYTRRRKDSLDGIEAAIAAVLPASVMPARIGFDRRVNCLVIDRIHYYPLSGGRLFVVGGGKAAGAMAQALEQLLPDGLIEYGLVNAKDSRYSTNVIKVNPAGHPVPDARGQAGVMQMLAIRDNYRLNEHDTVICLISGGASALMPYPAEGISLEEKILLTGRLLHSGASIQEINSVRKHVSRVKGGMLARYFEPARIITLIISDVAGNDLSVIASGPTAPDKSTYTEAVGVLEKYRLVPFLPGSIIQHLYRGSAGQAPETPEHLACSYNHIIADNRLALAALKAVLEERGYRTVVASSCVSGDTEKLARKHAGEIIGGKYPGATAVILGGESTVELPAEPGKGGRNQHYALVSLEAMARYKGEWLLAAAATDGSDYIGEAAGALVDETTAGKAIRLGLDASSAVNRFDSYSFFNAVGACLLITGDTGTNVADIMLYLL